MNWYKIATKELKPYKIYKIGEGQDVEIIELKYIWAYSSEQARMLALKKMPELKDFVDYCMGSHADCDIAAMLDMEEWVEHQRRQSDLETQKEKQIQEAWWNQ